MRLTFGDAEDLGQRKQTRREVFLGQMDQVVPWKALLSLIEPHYPKSGQPGRQPYALETMLRNGAYYGGEHGLRLEIFENSVDGSFFAFISPTGRTTVEVLIPDFESFMLFIKDYGGSFAAAGSEATQKVVMETLAKLFGALHGHDWSEACQLCDPVGWRRWNGMQDSG